MSAQDTIRAGIAADSTYEQRQVAFVALASLVARLAEAEHERETLSALLLLLRPRAKALGLREGWSFDAFAARLDEAIAAEARLRLTEEALREIAEHKVYLAGDPARNDPLVGVHDPNEPPCDWICVRDLVQIARAALAASPGRVDG